MRGLLGAYLTALFAITGFYFLALAAMRRPDIPHAVLARKYADLRSSFFTGPRGTQIHYRDEGRADGPALILVHGYFSSLHTWEPWVERLSAHYRVISIDLPGHGLTRTPPDYRFTKDSFFDVIEAASVHFDLNSFMLAGSSMGGAAAWDYARRRPSRVNALVLVASAGWTPAPAQDIMNSNLRDLLRSPMGPLVRDLDNSLFMRRGLRASFADATLAQEVMIQRYVELGRAPMNRDVLMQIALNEEARLYANPKLLARICAPTLVLHGGMDRVVPVQDSEQFAASISGAHLIVYEDVGHMLHEELPDQSAEDVHLFLQAARHGRRRPERHLMAA